MEGTTILGQQFFPRFVGRGGMDHVHAEACSDLVSQPGPSVGLAAEASDTDERSGRFGLAARFGVAPPVCPGGVGGEVVPAFARPSVSQPMPGLQTIVGQAVPTRSGDGGFSDIVLPSSSGSALARAPGGEVGVVAPSSPPERKRKEDGHASTGLQAACAKMATSRGQ